MAGIVEFPAGYCTLTAKPVLRRRMQAARLAFIRACGIGITESSYLKSFRNTVWPKNVWATMG